MLSLDDIFSLLVTSVGVAPANTLVETCEKEDMNRKPYESMGALDGNLPAFDNGFVFEYSPEPSVTARFEILETQGDILQAGLIVTLGSCEYPRGCAARRRLKRDVRP